MNQVSSFDVENKQNYCDFINNDHLKINIVGDNDLLANMTKSYLENNLGLNCCCTNKSSFFSQKLTLVDSLDKEIFLLDCSSLNVDEIIRTIDYISCNFPQAFIALYNLDEDTLIKERIVDRGVRGIFYRNEKADLFLKGIKAIINGKLWFSRDLMTDFILTKRGRSKKEKEHPLLTAREKEILALISVGLKNDQIADRLCISPHTVKTHIYNIFQKINVPNRIQAAFWALKNL